jgi:hypothetical protein
MRGNFLPFGFSAINYSRTISTRHQIHSLIEWTFHIGDKTTNCEILVASSNIAPRPELRSALRCQPKRSNHLIRAIPFDSGDEL